MRSLALVLLFVFTTVLWQVSYARWICDPCAKEDCSEEPVEYCMWGEVKNYCRKRVCAKGPGERCGVGLGSCGEGMVCKSDERCHGCSTQLLHCYNAKTQQVYKIST